MFNPAMTVVGCLVLSSVSASQTLPLEIDALAKLFRSRDAALARIEIGYWARHEGVDPTEGWYSEGVWSRKPGAMAVEREVGWRGESSRIERGVWDGARTQSLRRDPTGEHAVLSIKAHLGEPFSTYLPANFGLLHANGSWADALESGGLHQFLGYEEIVGRRCMKILFDQAPRDDGVFAHPVLLWVDVEETLLVLRSQTHLLYESYVLLRSTKEDANRVAASFGESSFIPYLRWEVEQVAELEPGLWIATRGRQDFPAAPQVRAVITEVDLSKTHRGREIPASTFVIERTPGMHVEDAIEGTSWDVVGEGSASVVDARFEEILRQIASEENIAYIAPVGTDPQPWETSSCGPSALYLLMRLHGSKASLHDVLKSIPVVDRQLASLGSLSVAAERLGMYARAVELNTDELQRLGGHVIARVLEDDGKTGHFAVASITDGGIRLVSPPDDIEVVSAEELGEIWTGGALILSREPFSEAGLLSQPTPASVSLLAGSLAAFVAGLVALRQRRRANGEPQP